MITWIVEREVLESSVKSERSGSTIPPSLPYLEYPIVTKLHIFNIFLHDEELFGKVESCRLRRSSITSQSQGEYLQSSYLLVSQVKKKKTAVGLPPE